MNTTGSDLIPCCTICDSTNVVMRRIKLSNCGVLPVVLTFWFECRTCGYSSPGKPTRDEAENFILWQRLDGQQPEQETTA